MDQKLLAVRDYLAASDLYFKAAKVRAVLQMETLATARADALIRLLAAILGREPTPEEIEQVQNGRS